MASHRRFEDTYQSHLKKAQRREVLDTLRDALERTTTIGEVIDAAETIGWGEAMGDLRLADLATALRKRAEAEADGQTLSERLAASPVSLVADADDDDDFEDAEDEFEDEVESPKKKSSKKKAAKKKASKKATAKKTSKVSKKTAAKKAAKVSKSTTAKKTSKKATKKKAASKSAGKKSARKK